MLCGGDSINVTPSPATLNTGNARKTKEIKKENNKIELNVDIKRLNHARALRRVNAQKIRPKRKTQRDR
ncbi:hypothetical protein HanIR_Chr10g0490581 [Helianthus annuus]|nr:hypothetical protein HanIR_Chr10g0490581 [Helianthus annuus]